MGTGKAPKRRRGVIAFPKPKPPQSIFFFDNGMVAVCDANGQQMPKYQGRTDKALAALVRDGFDWKRIPERHGSPQGSAAI